MPRTLRTATTRDLPFIIDLAKKHSNAIGFIPTGGLLVYAARGGISLALENDEPAGYLLTRMQHRCFPFAAHIVQAAVAKDAQRRHHGLSLVSQLEKNARDAGRRFLQLWDLRESEATHFWTAAGFVAIAERWGTTSRRRPCVLWRKPIDATRTAGLLQMPQQVKAHGPGGIWLSNTADHEARYAYNRTSTAEQLAFCRELQRNAA